MIAADAITESRRASFGTGTSGEALRASAESIDAATRGYYGELCAAHGGFIAAVDACDVSSRHGDRLRKIFIAPGALYREQPRFGSDGRVVRQAAEELGIACERIEVASLGSVTQNAELIAQRLAAEPDGSVVLVSLSKGGSDTRIALERHPAIARKFRAWINVCGLIRGTPISDSLLGTRWWQRGLLRGYLAYTRAHPEFVRQLSGEPGTLLGSPTRWPQGLRVISVVGVPLREHLAPNARIRHGRMVQLGPNDGSTLVHHAIVEGGDVYPVWGADHFLRTPEVPALLRRLLLFLERAR